MNALVYHGPEQKAWEQVDDPQILEPTDAIVRIDSSTICGTDLHILKGDVPEVEPGTILGHEAVGTIGVAAVLTARLFTPGCIVAIDVADARLERALELGADVTVNNSRDDPVAAITELTDGLGADGAIEAVGVPETFSSARSSSVPAAGWRTSACTGTRRLCTWRRSGSAT
jgi:threonine dehydrogenase-like Zn-dependent dehydrogenase